MTNKEVKDYLNRAYYLKKSILAKAETIQQLREQARNITVSLKPDIVDGGKMCTGFAGIVNSIIDLQFQISAQWHLQLKTHTEIHYTISKLENSEPKLALILEYRYLNQYGWVEICHKMGYSWRQIHNLHSKALKQIIIILEKSA